MTTRILLTVDTELAWRHYADGASWQENLTRSYDPAGVGVPYQLELLRRYDLKACFFVDPMPALVYGIEPVRRMVAPILDAGQEVQLHLHSFWYDLAQGAEKSARFELTDFDQDAQRALIETARDLLVAAGAPQPVAFRSGSYAANAATLGALRSIGILYDSSHNGAEHPWPSALPFLRERIDPGDVHDIVEIPISNIRLNSGGLRPLQLCALSTREMHAALRHACANHHPLVTIVSHSFELATRDGRRINHLIRKRFDRLCAFLKEHEAEMPTQSFASIDLEQEVNISKPMMMRPLQTAARMVEQLWGDARYERPVTTAIAFGGPPLIALEYIAGYVGL